MNLFFIAVFGLYFLLMILLIVGWKKALSARRKSKDVTKITVVIPFRNEASSIPQMIADLAKQNYSIAHTEVLLVNDHSEDRSAQIAAQQIVGRPQFRILSLPDGDEGKKRAITLALNNATGTIIATTDADCRISSSWLTSINEGFGDPDVKLAFGGVSMDGESFFSRLQALEFSSLIGVSGATAAVGLPTMCNGANLAFLRSTFLEVKGYEGNLDIASGDDEFLLRKIDHQFPNSVLFLNDPAAVVRTHPQKTVGDLIQQRLRWAGKWKYNSSPIASSLAIFVLVFQTSFIAIFGLLLLQRIDTEIAILLLAIKLLLESLFLFRVGSFLGIRWRTIHFLILQLLYPFYVVFIGATANFLPYQWKGRKRKSR